jgi:hypothetical protein
MSKEKIVQLQDREAAEFIAGKKRKLPCIPARFRKSHSSLFLVLPKSLQRLGTLA